MPEIVFESAPCPLGCPRGDSAVISGRDRIAQIPGLYHVVRCNTCELMRTDPRPTLGSMGKFYPDDYGPYSADISSADVPLRDTTKRRRLGLGAQHVPSIKPGHMLEVGCSNGSYMLRMQRAGWTVEGVEFSPTVAQIARSRGLNVIDGAIEAAPIPQKPYDLIVAWMVFEHLHEPVKVLRRLRQWAKPDAHLVFSVPDAASVECKIFGDASYALQIPTHLFHYTPRSITRVLDAAGWQVDSIFWQPNSVNLLRSIEYKFADCGMELPEKLFRKLATARSYARLRTALGWTLARLRQSGRMEVWARPAS